VKALVTGGAGFIGSHLVDALMARGEQVTVIDDLSSGSRRNVVQWEGNAGFRLLEHNVCDPLPDLPPHDAVYHLASPASPVGYGRRPIETLLTNSAGTARLLEAAKGWSARFLLASTSEVYGDPLEHPQKETYWGNVNPIGPRSCYDEGKRFAEALTHSYVQVHGLDARIVRIFNTYGPRNDPEDGRVVPNFIMQALHGQPLTVYGDGAQTRSFCYVADLVRGLLLAMEGSKGEVFNLGNPREVPIIEMARLVRELAGSASPIVHIEAREEEITRRRPDISKAKAQLGWSPQTPLEEGLRPTIDWFRALACAGGARER